jgi:hypothetical protein
LIPKYFNLIGFEAAIWLIGLIYLAFLNSPAESHFTICPFANIGIDFCPGCGLGRSISYIFKGDFSASIHSHPLGIFALIIIINRIITLIINNRRKYAERITVNAYS